MSTSPSPPLEIRVHHGDRTIEGLMRLMAMSTSGGPTLQVLGEMCREIAWITSADQVSVYAHQRGADGDRLLLRASSGGAADAMGRASLRVGEGLTGMVAEYLRPLSAAPPANAPPAAHQLAGYLGVPLVADGRLVGVLVVQRRHRHPDSAAAVAMVVALGAPVAMLLEQAQERPRSVVLHGVAVQGACALGRAVVVPSISALPDAAPADLMAALDRLRRDLDRHRRAFAERLDPDTRRAFDWLPLVLDDRRFRDRIAEAAAAPAGALRAVARDYARAAHRLGNADDTAVAERIADIEDLCVLLWANAMRQPLLPAGAIWLANRLGAFVAVLAAVRGASLVLEGPVRSSTAAGVARAGRVPVVAEVSGLFAWTRIGDLVVVDGDRGLICVNPTASEIERARRSRVRAA